MNGKALYVTLGALGMVAGVLGLVLSFLPLGFIPVVPALIGLFLGASAWFMAKKAGEKSRLVLAAIGVSGLAVVITLVMAATAKNEVAVDAQFEQKMEESKQEAQSDLDSALQDLEGELAE